MKLRSFIMLGFAFLLLLPEALLWSNEINSDNSSWEDYKIISERNIFSRSRLQNDQTHNAESRKMQSIINTEESYFILRGITRCDDRFVAFIEDSRTMEMEKVLKGGMIGKGKIKDITLDYVSYELGGKTARVEIGMTMEGQTTENVSRYSLGFDVPQRQKSFNFSSGIKTDVQATSQDNNTDAILQRLKERRKKELGE